MSHNITVTETANHKFKVMVDFIQRGVEYNGKEIANTLAKQIAQSERITIVNLIP